MIGMNLKYLRKKYGYSQEDLAERRWGVKTVCCKVGKRGSSSDVEKCVTMAQILKLR